MLPNSSSLLLPGESTLDPLSDPDGDSSFLESDSGLESGWPQEPGLLAGILPSFSEPVTGVLSSEGCACTSTTDVISITEESLTDRMSPPPENVPQFRMGSSLSIKSLVESWV